MEAVQQEGPAQGIEAVESAWKKYQVTEKYGLEFGKALCRYRDEHKSKGGNGSKGKGLGQLLDELSIPKSTAYWWVNRYEVSIGVKEEKPEKPRNWYVVGDNSRTMGVGTGHDRRADPSLPAKPYTPPVTYQCSLCNETFEVTADRVQPHYDSNHGTWHPPVNRPSIAGWSSMNAGEKLAAARQLGCAYCLAHDSARSCPAHGWEEKRHDHFNKVVSPLVELSHRLNWFLPTYSDGVEHSFVRLIEEVVKAPKDDLSPTDAAYLQSNIYELERLAKEFAEYAKQLREQALSDNLSVRPSQNAATA